MATKKRKSSRKTTKTKQKTSLVENINRRKRAGKSRPKSRSTVSKSAYRDMQAGWPKRKRAKKAKKSKKSKKSTVSDEDTSNASPRNL